MSWLLKATIAVGSTLVLTQIGYGWYGLWTNFVLLTVIVTASFALGYWGIE